MNLKQLAEAVKAQDLKVLKGPKILVFGAPKSGKTRMVGTVANMPQYKKVIWFDNENGIETLIAARRADGTPLLSDEAMAKIEVIRLDDTKDSPVAAETILKAFSSKNPVRICSDHGKVNCKECGQKQSDVMFSLPSAAHDTVVVVDSMSQLADSVFNLELKLYDYKHAMKYWGHFYEDMGNILSMIQTAKCVLVSITHEITIEDEATGKVVEIAPLCGSRNFSQKIGKYFGHVIYKTLELKKYKAISTGTWKDVIKAGSRLNIDVNKLADPTMADILNFDQDAPALQPTANKPAIAGKKATPIAVKKAALIKPSNS